ncbi:MAG: DJ-1/PfpI family protein, partial [Rhodospirillales bacterium]
RTTAQARDQPMGKIVGALLFPQFELLDMFGPLEMIGTLTRENAAGLIEEAPEIRMVAQSSDPVTSFQGPACAVDEVISSGTHFDILIIPGGPGVLAAEKNKELLDWIDVQCERSEHVATICTGSLLLAATGRLNGRKATTNKSRFAQETPRFPEVAWISRARWVEDGKYLTSSGVSAGMDMTLALVAKLYGIEAARSAAITTEYEWHDDPTWDPFAAVHGLP